MGGRTGTGRLIEQSLLAAATNAARFVMLRNYVNDFAARHANDPAYVGKELMAIDLGQYFVGIAGDENDPVLSNPVFRSYPVMTVQTRNITSDGRIE